MHRYSSNRAIRLAEHQLHRDGSPSRAGSHHHVATEKEKAVKRSIARMKQRVTTLTLMLKTIEEKQSQHLPKNTTHLNLGPVQIHRQSQQSNEQDWDGDARPLSKVGSTDSHDSLNSLGSAGKQINASAAVPIMEAKKTAFGSTTLREYQQLPKISTVPNFYKADHDWIFGFESRCEVPFCEMLILLLFVSLDSIRSKTIDMDAFGFSDRDRMDREEELLNDPDVLCGAVR
jgi:hypothetical protein